MKFEFVPLSSLERWPRNPKLHDEDRLLKSFSRFGFVSPCIVGHWPGSPPSGVLVAGHGRLDALLLLHNSGQPPPDRVKEEAGEWLIPVIHIDFASEKEAETYLLADNQLTISGGWNESLLNEIIKELEDPVGFEALSQDLSISDDQLPQPDQESFSPGDEPDLDHTELDPNDPHKLNEDVKFPSTNEWGVPDLRRDMLLDRLPSPLDTWGDKTSTPDDGTSFWLWVYGSSVETGLPYDRSVLGLWCHDHYLETFWANPEWRAKSLLKKGVKAVVVPDFSIWAGAPRALQLYSVYRAQWVGRFFQEAGLKVIPRLEYFVDSAKDFSLLGVPKGSPVVATQFQTDFDDSQVDLLRIHLEEACKLIEPKTLLVYASDRGRKLVEGANLPCELVVLPTVASKRRRKKAKETDPEMRKLRRSRKRPKEVSRTTSRF